MFALDFRQSNCNPNVVFVDSDSEGDEALTYVAKDFDEFLAQLREDDEYDH